MTSRLRLNSATALLAPAVLAVVALAGILRLFLRYDVDADFSVSPDDIASALASAWEA